LSPFITVVTVAAAALPANVNVAVTAATASQRFFITPPLGSIRRYEAALIAL
jgi:hypothetical protein